MTENAAHQSMNAILAHAAGRVEQIDRARAANGQYAPEPSMNDLIRQAVYGAPEQESDHGAELQDAMSRHREALAAGDETAAAVADQHIERLLKEVREAPHESHESWNGGVHGRTSVKGMPEPRWPETSSELLARALLMRADEVRAERDE